MNISHLKIGTRLSGAFALILLLLGSMLASAIWQLGKIEEAKTVMVEASHKAKLAAAWREHIATNGVRTLAKAKAADPAEEQVLDSEMKAVSAEVSKVQQELEKLITSEQGKANLQAVAEQRKVYNAVRNDVFRRKAEEGVSEAVKAAVAEKLAPEMKKYTASVEKVVAYQDTIIQNANANIDKVMADSRNFMLAMGLLALGCGIGLGLMLSLIHI